MWADRQTYRHTCRHAHRNTSHPYGWRRKKYRIQYRNNSNAGSLTRSTGTVHTSAKAVSRYGCRDTDPHQNLIVCSFAHCQPSLKISRKSVWKFFRKVANRQTNNDENVCSLAEVTTLNSMAVVLVAVEWTALSQRRVVYKPTSITLAGSELVRSWFEAGSIQIA